MTQVALLTETLRNRKFDVIVCRDPGSTPFGERVREILLNSDGDTSIRALRDNCPLIIERSGMHTAFIPILSDDTPVGLVAIADIAPRYRLPDARPLLMEIGELLGVETDALGVGGKEEAELFEAGVFDLVLEVGGDF